MSGVELTAAFLGEHLFDSHWDPATSSLQIGVGSPAGPPELPGTACFWCGTEIGLHGGDWRHEVGFKYRGGCTTPEPRP